MAASTPAEELTQLLSNYQTLQAQFDQVTRSGNRQDVQKSTGTLYMQRPGKFRWEIKTPSQQVIVANGSTLWIYDVDLEQVTKQTIDMRSASNPAILLSGEIAQLVKNYQVNKVLIENKLWYVLIPRSERSSFLVVRFYFSKNKLEKIWLRNSFNQDTEFTFTNLVLNKNISSALFEFKPPKGVDVLQ